MRASRPVTFTVAEVASMPGYKENMEFPKSVFDNHEANKKAQGQMAGNLLIVSLKYVTTAKERVLGVRCRMWEMYRAARPLATAGVAGCCLMLSVNLRSATTLRNYENKE